MMIELMVIIFHILVLYFISYSAVKCVKYYTFIFIPYTCVKFFLHEKFDIIHSSIIQPVIHPLIVMREKVMTGKILEEIEIEACDEENSVDFVEIYRKFDLKLNLGSI